MTEEDKTLYKSKSGFETVKVVRGFTEIKNLFFYLKKSNIACTICGGYVRYMASPLENPIPASDIDIYSETEEDVEKIKQFMHNNNLEIKHENNIFITYKSLNYTHPWFGCLPIQLIKPIKEGHIVALGDMKTILSNFDFTIIRAGLISETSVMVDADFVHDEQHKILRIKNIHCPVSSTLRCMKYSKKGYWLPPMQALKLFVDWQERGDDYRNRIVEFLEKANEGNKLSQEDIDELEKLMRID